MNKRQRKKRTRTTCPLCTSRNIFAVFRQGSRCWVKEPMFCCKCQKVIIEYNNKEK